MSSSAEDGCGRKRRRRHSYSIARATGVIVSPTQQRGGERTNEIYKHTLKKYFRKCHGLYCRIVP
eukprot:scaffold290899_cov42-Prasinocladus_malaysianus.AAC.2